MSVSTGKLDGTMSYQAKFYLAMIVCVSFIAPFFYFCGFSDGWRANSPLVQVTKPWSKHGNAYMKKLMQREDIDDAKQ